MTRSLRQLIVPAVLLVMGTSQVSAYDAETHALIAYQGYRASNLAQTGSGSVVSRLGLDRLDVPTPFNSYWLASGTAPGPLSYYDNTTSFDPATYPRQPNEYERCQMQHLSVSPADEQQGGTNYLKTDPMLGPDGYTVSFFPIENWLMRGDLREDDISPLGYKFAPEKCGMPDPDPLDVANNDFVHGVRVTNHFYDPINDIALTAGLGCLVGPTGACVKSVDWALGFVDSFATPPVANTSRRNHFTYQDARANMWLALVGEHGLSAPPYTSAAHAADAQERLYRWATTFRSLGDVIHLLQDGAQPQHVRNDAHNPMTTGERQAYEGYTNARVVGSGVANVNDYVREFFARPQQVTLPPIVLGTYPVPSFATPVRFFSTRLQADGPSVSPAARYGMMDYTNRSFFTGGTLPGSTGNAFQSPPTPIDASYTSIAQPCVLAASVSPTVTNLTCTHLMHAVPDSVDPGYVDELPHKIGQASAFSSPPLLLESAFKQVVPGSMITRPHSGYSVGLEEFQTMANLTIPRAIGYSAGVLNYFFRGQLAVTSPTEKVVAVLNQGTQHTMNAQGYPCVGTSTTDGCAVFGFQTIRVNVQNATPKITESGTGTQVPQNLSATAVGSVTDSSFHGPYLVAVARYHRNTCYKPDLSGEPFQTSAGITQPTCASGQVTRTSYQEISVSKSAALTAAQLNGTSSVEVQFDFSADPIPVNATDLFVQVVYRGPMGDPTLGQEGDAIAIGTIDVREPTFAAFWNNTDYFWNTGLGGPNWAIHSGTNPSQAVQTFWVCSGFPLKLMYQFNGVSGNPAMQDPVVFPGNPGVSRMAFIFPPPDFVGQQKTIQGTPVAFSGMAKIPIEQGPSSGEFHQANLENVTAATLAAPFAGCASSLPTAAQYWCFDPVQKRRGQLFGAVDQPLYLAPSGGAGSATDVDAAGLPAFSSITVQSGGTVHFDTDATLGSCPAQPASIVASENEADDVAYLKWLDLINEARNLGVSGESEPPLQQYH